MTASHHKTGVTLPEVMVAVLLVSAFFASIFELNAVCLRYIDASKESVAALQSIHDRCETLRNLDFTGLTTTATLQGVMATAPNTSDFCNKAIETVKISAYPTPNGVTQFTRSHGSVSTDSVATDLGTTLVKVDVSATWNMTLGGRQRSEQTSTIISNGSKK